MKDLILSEEELVKRCLNNDRHAQGFFFTQFYQELYLLAMRYLSDHHNAEDAIANAFVRAFKGLKSFAYQGQGSLGKWIRTILINESIRILKKKNLIQFDEDIKQLNVQNYEANGLQRLQASDITRMIEKLPTGYRTVFNLFIVEGYSHKEIGQMLGISENTSKSQLNKARNQLIATINKDQAYGTIGF